MALTFGPETPSALRRRSPARHILNSEKPMVGSSLTPRSIPTSQHEGLSRELNSKGERYDDCDKKNDDHEGYRR